VGEDCTEGLTEKLRAIKSVEVAFLVKQLSPSSSKISMRSETADVSKICEVFGGGGHKLAAGCLIKSNVDTAVKKILDEIVKLEL
jgi:phosphoesterase RecJ-like protein